MQLPEPILEISDEMYEEYHDDAAKALALGHLVIDLLEEIGDKPEYAARIGFTQDDVDALEDAFRATERLLDHDRYETFKREGWHALTPEDRHAIRRALARVDVFIDAEIRAPPEPEEYLLENTEAALVTRGS